MDIDAPRVQRPGRACLGRLGAVLLLLGAFLASASAAAGTPSDPVFAPGEVIIGWRPDSGIVPAVPRSNKLQDNRHTPEWRRAVEMLSELTGLEVLDARTDHAFALLAVTHGREATEIARLRTLPWVRYAEPNYTVRAASLPEQGGFYPNDTHISSQWHMRRAGAPEAWAVAPGGFFGSYSLVVAVVDSGIDRSHLDFAPSRLLNGKDYVNDDYDPFDDYGHGTQVTGIIAAVANNSRGVAGLAANVQILPLKVLAANGVGYDYDIASAVSEAADYGMVQIINLSLGGTQSSTAVRDAINKALSKGILVVAAAGNCAQPEACGLGMTNPDFYPAAYPGVMAVAASDHYDNWAAYSGHKPYVFLAAPGGLPDDQIISTLPVWKNSYGWQFGTSLATPLVSAAAALVWTLQPGATSQQVTDILKNTADKVGSEPYANFRNDYFGYGRLNVGRAVRQAYPPSLAAEEGMQYFLLGGTVTEQERQLSLANPSEQEVWWQVTVPAGGEWLTAWPTSGAARYSSPGVLNLRAGPAALAPGTYNGTVHVEWSQLQSPYAAGSFDISVQLRVTDARTLTFLPAILNHWTETSWQDPFDPYGFGGRALYLEDNGNPAWIGLPFTTQFFGQYYTDLWVSDNGWVYLGSSKPQNAVPSGCPPLGAAPNNAIYVLALDWNPNAGGAQVYVHQPDADTLAITWYQVQRTGVPQPQTFQLVFRRNGAITAFYRDIETPAPGVVGTENFDGTVAWVSRCDGAGRQISNGDAVLFRAVLPW